MRPLTCSCFLLHLLERLSLLAHPHLLGTCLPLLWSPLIPLHAPALILPLSLRSALAHLDSIPPYDLVLWTDGSVPFRFGKGGSGVLANCSLRGHSATRSLRYSASFLLVSAAPASLPLLFSSYLTLALSSPPSFLLLQSLVDLAGTVFSLLLCY